MKPARKFYEDIELASHLSVIGLLGDADYRAVHPLTEVYGEWFTVGELVDQYQEIQEADNHGSL